MVGVCLPMCTTVGICLPMCTTVGMYPSQVPRWVCIPLRYHGGYSLPVHHGGYSLLCTTVGMYPGIMVGIIHPGIMVGIHPSWYAPYLPWWVYTLLVCTLPTHPGYTSIPPAPVSA